MFRKKFKKMKKSKKGKQSEKGEKSKQSFSALSNKTFLYIFKKNLYFAIYKK